MMRLHQSYYIITWLEDHIIVRSSYHHPGQLLTLVLIITVRVHHSAHCQAQRPGLLQGGGVQRGEERPVLSVPERGVITETSHSRQGTVSEDTPYLQSFQVKI